MTFGDPDTVGAEPEECRRILDAYADAGGNVVDTAINYRGGASESILGELLEGRRDRFVVSTKHTVSRDGSDPNAAGNHRKDLRLSLDTSLHRLRTDYIDLYWVHLWDAHTPIEETMRALDDVVRDGKVLYLGVSDTPAWIVAQANTLAAQHGWTPFAALQAPYSILQRDIERELLPLAQAFGMSVAAWSPLAGGILTGKFTRQGGPGSETRVSPGTLTERDLAVARSVPSSGPVASISCSTTSQPSIARCRPRPCDVSTIRQTSSPASQPTSSTKRARGCSVRRLRESTRAESPGRAEQPRVLPRCHPEPRLEVSVKVALIKEPDLDGSLDGRHATFE
jgi:aryl-alcohol dehydrogenase-like predicted oxidoreductase